MMDHMKLYKREKYLKKIRGFYHDTDIIKVISGVRRCGKSCLMQMIADELTDNGVPQDNVFFYNLDRYGYKNVKTADDLEKLLFQKEYPSGIKYVFIDEIQHTFTHFHGGYVHTHTITHTHGHDHIGADGTHSHRHPASVFERELGKT